jgi:hypothetical protein
MQTSDTAVEAHAPHASRGVFGHEPGSWVPVTLFLGFIAITLLQILAFNDGVLVYDMDDPYIGYALAEEIAKGNYGINPGEASSPASTILWPFLLAPFLLVPGGLWAPLWINVACVGLAIYVLYGSLAGVLRSAGATAWRALATTGAIASILLLSLTFVTFAGMEHGPQVLLAVIVAAGLVELARAPAAHPSKALVAALLLGPLFRFEAMALTVPALAILWQRGHRRLAGWIAMGAVIPLVSFVAFLSAQGVGPLPSSLSSRQSHMANAGFLEGISANLSVNFLYREALIVALLTIPFLAVPLDRTRVTRERMLGAWMLAVVVLHFCFGRFGYWGRYEAYLWGLLLVTAPFLARHALARWANPLGTARAALVAAFFLLAISYSYVGVTIRTPLASNDIYIEHREMNRLVTEFLQAPVGVNDVGYVSFNNDDYVLDLFGLTSHDVRRRRNAAGTDPAWMDELVRQHDVDLVMVYLRPDFVPRVPSSWSVLGHLRVERFKALLAERTVTLFATRSEPVPELRSKLAAFAENLPVGIRLDLALESAGAAPDATTPLPAPGDPPAEANRPSVPGAGVPRGSEP